MRRIVGLILEADVRPAALRAPTLPVATTEVLQQLRVGANWSQGFCSVSLGAGEFRPGEDGGLRKSLRGDDRRNSDMTQMAPSCV